MPTAHHGEHKEADAFKIHSIHWGDVLIMGFAFEIDNYPASPYRREGSPHPYIPADCQWREIGVAFTSEFRARIVASSPYDFINAVRPIGGIYFITVRH